MKLDLKCSLVSSIMKISKVNYLMHWVKVDVTGTQFFPDVIYKFAPVNVYLNVLHNPTPDD